MTSTPRPKLILASTSPYRREVLGRLGIPFEARAPDFLETHDSSIPAEDLVLQLAEGKARSLGPSASGCLVLGADQLAEIDGGLLTKPGTPEAAKRQLARLQGKEHRLYTGVVLYEPASGRIERALDCHRLKMRSLTREQISAYVETERPIDCAGAYKIEQGGIGLFESVRGDDFTAVIGLPLTVVVDLFGRFGVSWPHPAGEPMA